LITVTPDGIRRARLHNQRLASGRLSRPEQVVSWLGAVQAQEYHGAKWAIALRMRRASDAAIEREFAEGRILRTHVLRPTWHFVTPADIRWMLALTAPRVEAILASYDRRLGIDAALVRRSNRAIAGALHGGRHQTRQELSAALARAGIVAGGQRLARLVIHAELDAVICSGPRRNGRSTYALLDERAPARRTLARDDALAELTRRYFTARGPAQVRDFAWWSGLTMGDARAGLDMAGRHLASEEIDGTQYWFAADLQVLPRRSRAAYLLPPYDEYLIAYKDRSAAVASVLPARMAGPDPFIAPLVIDGLVAGAWKLAVTKQAPTVILSLPAPLSRADARVVREAVNRFGAFVGSRLRTSPD
jgi:hypothetical protein